MVGGREAEQGAAGGKSQKLKSNIRVYTVDSTVFHSKPNKNGSQHQEKLLISLESKLSFNWIKTTLLEKVHQS